jgi:large subunit ribosomal protein L4
MRLSVYDTQGNEVDQIEVDDAVFGIEPNRAVVHQALLAQQANQRQGTANTKTRGEVRGSTRKIRRQKGTGRARQGSIRAPHHRGGGIVFGPKTRDYSQRLPKRMRRLAIRSVLSARAQEGSLKVVDALSFDEPDTRRMAETLAALGLDRSVLIVTGQPDERVKLSARNLPDADVLPAAYLNVGDMLAHRNLLLTVDAVRRAEALWGGERAVRRRAPLPAEVGG